MCRNETYIVKRLQAIFSYITNNNVNFSCIWLVKCGNILKTICWRKTRSRTIRVQNYVTGLIYFAMRWEVSEIWSLIIVLWQDPARHQWLRGTVLTFLLKHFPCKNFSTTGTTQVQCSHRYNQKIYSSFKKCMETEFGSFIKKWHTQLADGGTLNPCLNFIFMCTQSSVNHYYLAFHSRLALT